MKIMKFDKTIHSLNPSFPVLKGDGITNDVGKLLSFLKPQKISKTT